MKHGNQDNKQGCDGNHDHKPHGHCETGHDKDLVLITVDKPVKIPFGKHTVAEVKALAGVPASFDLEIIVNCRLIPLKDDETITIEGGEQFSAQPRCGVAS